jgi:tetratricopeptide (TPR) repeat protein
MIRIGLILIAVLFGPPALAQDAQRGASGPQTVIGPRNPNLQKGAELLLAGRTKEGVEMTLRGLRSAQGTREEEAGLSNLCAGYVVLERFTEALKYCEMLLKRNDKSWRAYNNRALIYIFTEQYDKAHQDLVRAEELHPGARTLMVARTIYLNAVDPVEPVIEIDDRQVGDDDDRDRKQP